MTTDTRIKQIIESMKPRIHHVAAEKTPIPGKQYYICRGMGDDIEYLCNDGNWNKNCWNIGSQSHGYYTEKEAKQKVQQL